jgi:hydrogenase expression/formation protein HypC
VCTASPARLLAFDSTDAIVEVDGRRRRASMLLRPEVQVDDWVLVAAGTVVRRIDAAEALELRRALDAAAAALASRTPAPSQGGTR